MCAEGTIHAEGAMHAEAIMHDADIRAQCIWRV